MVTGIIDIPNLVAGAWMPAEKTKVIADFQGIPRLRIHGATPTQVRIAKRTMLQVREQLATTPLRVLVRVVKAAVQHYFTDATDYDLVARLSGSPISYVYGSIETLKRWLANIDQYLANAFGDADYEHVPVVIGETFAGYRRFAPTGPTIAILPQNDDGVSAYVLAQLLLSKNPVIVKPSSNGGSAFSTARFIHALHAAIQLHAPDYPHLLKAIQLVHVLDDGPDRANQVAQLGLDGANFVIFGSNESVAELANAVVQHVSPRALLRLGTGFSVSAILPDANLAASLHEVYESVIEDRGNKCTSTHALYVHDQVAPPVFGELDRLAQQTHPTNPLDTRARTGHLDAETRAAVAKRIGELYPMFQAPDPGAPPSFRWLEVDEHARIEELPGPWLFVKRFRDIDHLCALMAADRTRNRMERNLATSVFTEDRAVVDEIARRMPSHIVKWNIGSHAINFFLEHQGMFIMRELMTQTLVEELHTRKAQLPALAEAERR